MTLARHEMLIGAGKPSGPFHSTWRTTTAGEKITLPLSGGAGSAYNFVVDWGDGTVDTITASNSPLKTHAYATPGDHLVKIGGTLTGWAFASGGDRLKIRSIDQWGILRFTNGQNGHFDGCTNLTIPALDAPVLSHSCQRMFKSCTALSVCPLMTTWDTSMVTDMTSMFNLCSNFNQDVSMWKVGKVTQFFYMFGSTTKFNQPLGSWDTSSAINMGSMFTASGFNQDINSWNTSKVTNMSGMFSNNKVFNQPLSNWNTSKVTDMTGMFSGCKLFNQDIGGWNTGAVTKFTQMFKVSPAFNCGQPAGAVHQLMNRTVTGGWRIGGVTSANLSEMFYNAYSFAGDLSQWCADVATTPPTSFTLGAHANHTAAMEPTWGACPIPD